MLNQPETLNGIDIHMLAHLQIVMRLKDPEVFSVLMEAVESSPYRKFYDLAEKECLKKMELEGNDY